MAYVRSLSGLPVDSLKCAARQAALHAANCAACHGADGKGNPALGAPNLADNIWLYGGSLAAITETVTKGRGDPRGRRHAACPRTRTCSIAAKIQLLDRVRVGAVAIAGK